MNPCLICGQVDEEKAMCFRNTEWCCDDHRKILAGERPVPKNWTPPPNVSLDAYGDRDLMVA